MFFCHCAPLLPFCKVQISRKVVNRSLPTENSRLFSNQHLNWGRGGQETLFFLNGSTILQLIVGIAELHIQYEI